MSVRRGAGLRDGGGGQALRRLCSIPCRCGGPGRRRQPSWGGSWGRSRRGGCDTVTSTARQPCTGGGGGGGYRPRAGGRGSPGSAARPHTAFNGADGPRRDSHTGVSHRAGPGRVGEAAPPRPPGAPPAYGAPRPAGLARQPANGRADLPPALEQPLRPNESSEDTAAKCWGGLEGRPWGGSCALACRRGQPVLRIGLMVGTARPNQKGAGEGGGEGGGRNAFSRLFPGRWSRGGRGRERDWSWRAGGPARRGPGEGRGHAGGPESGGRGRPAGISVRALGGGYLSKRRGRAPSWPRRGLPQREGGTELAEAGVTSASEAGRREWARRL